MNKYDTMPLYWSPDYQTPKGRQIRVEAQHIKPGDWIGPWGLIEWVEVFGDGHTEIDFAAGLTKSWPSQSTWDVRRHD